MTCRILTPAVTEMVEAAEYYERVVEGLGADFIGEVDSAIDRILRFPEA